MAVSDVVLRTLASRDLTDTERGELLSLCAAAYDEDLSAYLLQIGPGTHVFATIKGVLVSHAMWVTRWLQQPSRPPLRTAYVELVATRPSHERRGLASRVLRQLVHELPSRFDIAALSPTTSAVYLRLGWRFWEGPLFVRLETGALEPSPEERIMVLDLHGRPPIDTTTQLSIEWRPGEVW